MIAYVEQRSEFDLMCFLKKYGYRRIISIYLNGDKVICWYED